MDALKDVAAAAGAAAVFYGRRYEPAMRVRGRTAASTACVMRCFGARDVSHMLVSEPCIVSVCRQSAARNRLRRGRRRTGGLSEGGTCSSTRAARFLQLPRPACR